VVGSAGEDVVIGASTDYDNNIPALQALLAEWGSSGDFLTRVSHLRSGGGLNGAFLLNSSSVHDDAASDQLTGSSSRDWFFQRASGASKDKITDFSSGYDLIELI